MNATARLVFDRTYYESNYDAWLKHRAKLRPYVVHLSLLLLTLGVIMALVLYDRWFIGAILACIGVFELIDGLTHKTRWVNARVRATRENKTVDMQLSETEVTTKTSAARGTIQVAAFSDIVLTSDGVFLIPESGVSIYIPASTVEPANAFRPIVRAWMAARRSR